MDSMRIETEDRPDRPQEECGVFGIYGHPQAAPLTYYGLVALQHRGQEAAGIATTDGIKMYSHKGLGLLADVFKHGELEGLVGHAAIGHVRYSTAGCEYASERTADHLEHARAQYRDWSQREPRQCKWLRIRLEQEGSLFQTTTDTEVIAHLIAKAGMDDLAEAVAAAAQQIQGGFSVVILGNDELVAVRDPLGLRPMVLGQLGQAYVVASESCALDTMAPSSFGTSNRASSSTSTLRAGIESIRHSSSTKDVHV